MQIRSILTSVLLTLGVTNGWAAVSPDESSKLGNELTSVGATASTNADGTIPSWQGGDPAGAQDAAGFPQNMRIDNDQSLFVITAANYMQYASRLTEGHKQLFSRYKDYRMAIYPTRRTASYPKEIEVGTAANATACQLVGTDQPLHCTRGFPFPIPHTGAEAMWNHKLRWRGEAVERYNSQFMVASNGSRKQNRLLEQVRYFLPVPSGAPDFELFRLLVHTLAPARIADSWLLVRESTGTSQQGRAAWVSKAKFSSARRAPILDADKPYPDTDGMQFYDQVDMFNGDLSRYDWKLVGKKELYLPYNSNHIDSSAVKYSELIGARHINQNLARYELHRYWVVEATLKPGEKHRYKMRRFYIDEDSWNVEAVDNLSGSGALQSFQEGHLVNFSGPQITTTAPQVIYDFLHGSYFVSQAFNEDRPPDFNVHWSEDHFDPAVLERLASH